MRKLSEIDPELLEQLKKELEGDKEEVKEVPKLDIKKEEKPKVEIETQYVAVPKVVTIEEMLNIIYEQNNQILTILQKH